jgi:murein DD-endopeptidase MepM/ murein hydrolase activator NlpD
MSRLFAPLLAALILAAPAAFAERRPAPKPLATLQKSATETRQTAAQAKQAAAAAQAEAAARAKARDAIDAAIAALEARRAELSAQAPGAKSLNAAAVQRQAQSQAQLELTLASLSLADRTGDDRARLIAVLAAAAADQAGAAAKTSRETQAQRRRLADQAAYLDRQAADLTARRAAADASWRAATAAATAAQKSADQAQRQAVSAAAALDRAEKAAAQARAKAKAQSKAKPKARAPVATSLAPAPDECRIAPVAGVLETRFGQSLPGGRTARAQSWRAAPGAQVKAPVDSTVSYVGPVRGYGQVLILERAGGYAFVLTGLEEISVPIGARVSTGQGVAAASPVVGFEVRRNGAPIDPRRWLAAAKR